MTIGTAYSLYRLQKQSIFCISPGKVNVAGRIRLMVFDKTGTLTEDGL
jgi:magnesium-transporting ATPase (P-type)